MAETEHTARYTITTGRPAAYLLTDNSSASLPEVPVARSRDEVVRLQGVTDAGGSSASSTVDATAATAAAVPAGVTAHGGCSDGADGGGLGDAGLAQGQCSSKRFSLWCIVGIVLIVVLIVLAIVLVVIFVFGDDHPGPAPLVIVWECKSDLQGLPAIALNRKGITLDAETLSTCADRIPRHWPNAGNGSAVTSVQMVRLSARDVGNSQSSSDRLVAWVHATDARVLLTTQLSCNETADNIDWARARSLLRALGSASVLGVSFGNELELLFTQPGVDWKCVERLWRDGYITSKLADRVRELDEIPGFSSTPVTSSIGWLALAEDPFYDKPDAKVNSMLKFGLERFGKRWAFAVNIYPYFGDDWELDANTTSKCTRAEAQARCFDGAGCSTIAAIADVRRKMALLNVSANHTLWVTEVGWSWPQAPTLSSDMILCPAWSSEKAFRDYYAGFLAWDLSLPAGLAAKASATLPSSVATAPDYVFWAALRDVGKDGYKAHLGLVATCETQQCKLQKDLEPDPEPPSPACNSSKWPACSGLLGVCCPAADGQYLECCNRPAPVDRSSCSSPLWPGCAGLAGDCCPTAGGTYLACCGGSTAPQNQPEVLRNQSDASQNGLDEAGQVNRAFLV